MLILRVDSADIVIEKKLLWLGGSISVPGQYHNYGLRAGRLIPAKHLPTDSLTANRLHCQNTQHEQKDETRGDFPLTVFNYGTLIMEGTFTSSLSSLNVVVYHNAEAVIMPFFQILGLNYINIFNMGTIKALVGC